MSIKHTTIGKQLKPIFEKHKELKRLQKEIDEAEQQQNDLTVANWGRSEILGSIKGKTIQQLIQIKENNTQAIKEIIESL